LQEIPCRERKKERKMKERKMKERNKVNWCKWFMVCNDWNNVRKGKKKSSPL
jgi:hypothetical protein